MPAVDACHPPTEQQWPISRADLVLNELGWSAEWNAVNWSASEANHHPPAPSAKAGCIDRAPARAVDNVLIAKLLAQLSVLTP